MENADKIKILAFEITSRKNQIQNIEVEIKRFEEFLADIDNVKITNDDIEYLGDKKDG